MGAVAEEARAGRVSPESTRQRAAIGGAPPGQGGRSVPGGAGEQRRTGRGPGLRAGARAGGLASSGGGHLDSHSGEPVGAEPRQFREVIRRPRPPTLGSDQGTYRGVRFLGGSRTPRTGIGEHTNTVRPTSDIAPLRYGRSGPRMRHRARPRGAWGRIHAGHDRRRWPCIPGGAIDHTSPSCFLWSGPRHFPPGSRRTPHAARAPGGGGVQRRVVVTSWSRGGFAVAPRPSRSVSCPSSAWSRTTVSRPRAPRAASVTSRPAQSG